MRSDGGGGRESDKKEKEKEEAKEKEEKENVIYYQPPPEGYQEPSHINLNSVAESTTTKDSSQDAQSRSEPQLGYIFDAARPQEGVSGNARGSAQMGVDAETIGIGSTHGGKNSEGGFFPFPFSFRNPGIMQLLDIMQQLTDQKS